MPVTDASRIAGGNSAGRTVWFDVTDLLIYLEDQRHVSGIQRVQCGYIINVLSHADAAGRYRFCLRQQSADGYRELRGDLLARMVNVCSSRAAADPLATVDGETWRRHVCQIREAAALPARMGRGDVLCILGAPWIVQDFYLLVGHLKRDLGVLCVQLIHDVVPTVMPEVCYDGVIDVFNRALAGTLKYADAVLTISRHTADGYRQVAGRLGLSAPCIVTVPVGGGVSYDEPCAALPTDQAIGPIAAGVTAKPFVLCVGTLEPRKNHAYLFSIWRRLVREMGEQAPDLVCVGRTGWHMADFLRQLRVTDHLGGKFRIVTGLSDADLSHLYRTCLFTVFPSLHEGWGLPVAESLAAGKVCVASNAASIPEVGGDLAIYVDPLDVGSGYDVISGLVEDPDRLRAYEDRIRTEYRATTWTEATERLLREIDTLAGDRTTTPSRSVTRLGVPYSFAWDRLAVDPYQRVLEEMRRLDAHALLASGRWHESGAGAVWSNGRTAELLVPVERGTGDLLITMDLCAPSGADAQEVTVCVNGIQVMRETVDARKRTYRVPVPAQRLAMLHGEVDLLSVTACLGSAVEQGRNAQGDQRVPGIGLTSFMVCAADDVQARLEAIERCCIEMQVTSGI